MNAPRRKSRILENKQNSENFENSENFQNFEKKGLIYVAQ